MTPEDRISHVEWRLEGALGLINELERRTRRTSLLQRILKLFGI
jgi:hypothetical protein